MNPSILAVSLKTLCKHRAQIGAGLSAFTPLMALANPTGGQVVAGAASITNSNANTTTIKQSSQNAAINWQSFNIGLGQMVQFIQPSSSSVVLNRVVGGSPTSILGSLTANGQVFLVNTSGIYFGKGAHLDAQGILASTLDISNSNFMAKNYTFTQGSGTPGATVVNQGTLTAKTGGYVVLAGNYAENDGIITAKAGHVVLASGKSDTLVLGGNSLVSFAVNQATLAAYAGVANSGSIIADGGVVVMTADVANQLKATVVNNSGLIQAHAISAGPDGIYLSATGGNLQNSGTLDVSATGTVQGGNVVLVTDSLLNLSKTSKILATSKLGQGGNITFRAGKARFGGSYKVGRGGTLLLDPASITLKNGATGAGSDTLGTATLVTQLGSLANVVISASTHIGHSAAATLLTTASAGSLTLKVGAGGSIALGGLNINIGGAFKTSVVGSTHNAAQSFGFIKAAGVDIEAGDQLVKFTGATSTQKSVQATTGDITINGGQADLISGAALSMSAAGDLNFDAPIRGHVAYDVTLTAGHDANVRADILTTGAVSITGSNVQVGGATPVTLAGATLDLVAVGAGPSGGVLSLVPGDAHASNDSVDTSVTLQATQDVVLGGRVVQIQPGDAAAFANGSGALATAKSTVTISAGRDVIITGGNSAAAGVYILAGRADVGISSDTQTGVTATAQTGVSITAGHDLDITGYSITLEGGIAASNAVVGVDSQSADAGAFAGIGLYAGHGIELTASGAGQALTVSGGVDAAKGATVTVTGAAAHLSMVVGASVSMGAGSGGISLGNTGGDISLASGGHDVQGAVLLASHGAKAQFGVFSGVTLAATGAVSINAEGSLFVGGAYHASPFGANPLGSNAASAAVHATSGASADLTATQIFRITAASAQLTAGGDIDMAGGKYQDAKGALVTAGAGAKAFLSELASFNVAVSGAFSASAGNDLNLYGNQLGNAYGASADADGASALTSLVSIGAVNMTVGSLTLKGGGTTTLAVGGAGDASHAKVWATDGGVAVYNAVSGLSIAASGDITVQGNAGLVLTGASRQAAAVSLFASYGGDADIMADGNLSMAAGGALTLSADGTITLQTGRETAGDAVVTASDANADYTVSADLTLNAAGDMTLNLGGGNLLIRGGDSMAKAAAVNLEGSGDGYAGINADARVSLSGGGNFSVNGANDVTASAGVFPSVAVTFSRVDDDATANMNSSVNVSGGTVAVHHTGAINTNSLGGYASGGVTEYGQVSFASAGIGIHPLMVNEDAAVPNSGLTIHHTGSKAQKVWATGAKVTVNSVTRSTSFDALQVLGNLPTTEVGTADGQAYTTALDGEILIPAGGAVNLGTLVGQGLLISLDTVSATGQGDPSLPACLDTSGGDDRKAKPVDNCY